MEERLRIFNHIEIIIKLDIFLRLDKSLDKKDQQMLLHTIKAKETIPMVPTLVAILIITRSHNPV